MDERKSPKLIITPQTTPEGSLLMTIATVVYCVWGLTNIGLLYEKSSLAWPSELLRCVTTITLFTSISHVYMISASLIYNVFTVSSAVCVCMLINSATTEAKEKIF